MKYTKADLLPLVLREVVLHGGFDPIGIGDGTPGEIDGNLVDGVVVDPQYENVLPVAAGEWKVANSDFNVIPLPAAGWMLLSALGALGLLGRGSARRREA